MVVVVDELGKLVDVRVLEPWRLERQPASPVIVDGLSPEVLAGAYLSRFGVVDA